LCQGITLLWHCVSKMSGLYGTFADNLCQVIFVRSLNFKKTVVCQLISQHQAIQSGHLQILKTKTSSENRESRRRAGKQELMSARGV